MQIIGPPAPETLRPDQRERRARVVTAALRALARTGHDDVKISDVARDANVALATLYRYFASKDHLLAAAFLEWHSALKTKLNTSGPSGSEADRLRAVLREVVRAYQLQPQFFRVMMLLQDTTDAHAKAIYDALGPLFRAAVEAALGGPLTTDQQHILDVASAVLDGALRSWIAGRMTITEVYDRIDQAVRLIYEYPR